MRANRKSWDGTRLSMDTNRVLWYHRLCHMNTKVMGRTSKVVNGIPNFSSDTDLDGFDVCFSFDMIRNAPVKGNTRRDALKKNQGIILYWGFMMHKYHDKEIAQRLTGMYVE